MSDTYVTHETVLAQMTVNKASQSAALTALADALKQQAIINSNAYTVAQQAKPQPMPPKKPAS